MKDIYKKHGLIAYCKTCDKYFRPLGIAIHQAVHRDRKEYCQIEYSDGRVESWHYAVETKTEVWSDENI